MTNPKLVELWPPAGLSVRAGDLELRWPDDDTLVELADIASRGVHDPERMPFTVPWTRGTPEAVARSVLSFQWSTRGAIGPKAMRLELAVVVDGVIVGMQGAAGSDWAVLREVETGSWLGSEFQGRGIGTRMRVLMLALLFDGFGAHSVTSSARDDNAASNAVSLRAGYEPDGLLRADVAGEAAEILRYRMTRPRWESLADGHTEILGAPVEITGAEPVRRMLEGTP